MSGKRIHLIGCAKGAGMIHPNMATTLAFVATDANHFSLSSAANSARCHGFALQRHSVDGDTSTNDTLHDSSRTEQAARRQIANGTKAHRQFFHGRSKPSALRSPNKSSPTAKAPSASSKSKFAAPKTESAAKKIAETIAPLPRQKTASRGGRPIGAASSPPQVVPASNLIHLFVEITMAGIKVFKTGQPLDFNERAASNKLSPTTSLSSSIYTLASPQPSIGFRLHRRIRPHQRLLPHVNIHRGNRTATRVNSLPSLWGAAQMSKVSKEK